MASIVNASNFNNVFDSLNALKVNIKLSSSSKPSVVSSGTTKASDYIALYDMIKDMEQNDPMPPPSPAPTLSFNSGEVASGAVIGEGTKTKIENSANGWLKYGRSINRSWNTQGDTKSCSNTSHLAKDSQSYANTANTDGDNQSYANKANTNGDSQSYKNSENDHGDSQSCTQSPKYTYSLSCSNKKDSNGDQQSHTQTGNSHDYTQTCSN